MNIDELRRRVGAILDAEEREPPDWSQAKRLIGELEPQLDRRSECPEIVWHFLWDTDLRERNPAFGAQQREPVRRFVDTGEYTNGSEAPPWTCALVIAVAAGAVLLWLVL